MVLLLQQQCNVNISGLRTRQSKVQRIGLHLKREFYFSKPKTSFSIYLHFLYGIWKLCSISTKEDQGGLEAAQLATSASTQGKPHLVSDLLFQILFSFKTVDIIKAQTLLNDSALSSEDTRASYRVDICKESRPPSPPPIGKKSCSIDSILNYRILNRAASK